MKGAGGRSLDVVSSRRLLKVNMFTQSVKPRKRPAAVRSVSDAHAPRSYRTISRMRCRAAEPRLLTVGLLCLRPAWTTENLFAAGGPRGDR
jgi:hypothetical protein